MRLAGKVAIVTGASRGLGQYVAEAFGREGATVVVAARTEEVKDERLPGTIHETVEKIQAAGGRALAVRCNVSDLADCEALAKATLDAFGRIDILVNNAAVQPPGTMTTVQPRHWDVEMRVNVNGPFYCTRAVLDAMRSQGSGAIINVSSVGADHARAGEASHYGLTKVALETMTACFASELKDAVHQASRGNRITNAWFHTTSGSYPRRPVVPGSQPTHRPYSSSPR
jgi:NAD(P)-dependent dehydrogenase (short-subunit alcohol dehydrogenase family)